MLAVAGLMRHDHSSPLKANNAQVTEGKVRHMWRSMMLTAIFLIAMQPSCDTTSNEAGGNGPAIDTGAPINTGGAATDGACGGTSGAAIMLTPREQLSTAIATDAKNVYYVPLAVSYESVGISGTDNLQSIAKDGGTPAELCSSPTTSFVTRIAVDATHVYWADGARFWSVPITGGDATLLASFSTEIPEGGIDALGSPEAGTLDALGTAVPAGMVVTNETVFLAWTLNDNDFKKSRFHIGNAVQWSLNGGQTTKLAAELGYFNGIAVDTTSVYLAGDAGLLQVPIGGGTVETLLFSLHAKAVAVDATNIYWTGSVDNATRVVMSMPKGGGTVRTLASGAFNPVNGAVAVDNTSVYWIADDSIYKVPIDGGAVTTIACGQQFASALAVDDTSVYWVNASYNGVDGAIMKLTPK